MQLKPFLVSAAVVLTFAVPVVASATTESLNFSGAGQYGPVNGLLVLDVVSGTATSGTGWIDGSGIAGKDALTLITPSTPGAGGYPQGIGWRDGSGTDTWGYDNLIPMNSSDPLNGMVFSFGCGSVDCSWGQGDQFGIWSTGSDAFQGWMSGRGGGNDPFWGTTGSLTVTEVPEVSSTPEPSTWVMVLLGLAGLGIVKWRVSRRAPIAD